MQLGIYFQKKYNGYDRVFLKSYGKLVCTSGFIMDKKDLIESLINFHKSFSASVDDWIVASKSYLVAPEFLLEWTE